MKTKEEKLINDHEAKENVPYIVQEAIKQADYLPDVIVGMQTVINPHSGVRVRLTPLAYKVYNVAMCSYDILQQLKELSDISQNFPKTTELMKAKYQEIWNNNYEIWYQSDGWFCEYYIDERMKLLD